MAYDPAVYNLEKYRTELQAMLSQDASDAGWSTAQLNAAVNRAIRSIWRWLVKRDPGFSIVESAAYPLVASEIEDPVHFDLDSDVLAVVGLTGTVPYPQLSEADRRIGQEAASGWWVDGARLYVKGVGALTNEAEEPRDFTDPVWEKTNGTVQAGLVACLDKTIRTTNTFTASGANATLLQEIAVDDAYRAFAIYLRRVSGTGTVRITLNGGTWLTLPTLLTDRWTRHVVGGVVSGAGSYVEGDYVDAGYVGGDKFGIQLVTSGDSVFIDDAVLGAPELALLETLETPATLASDAAVDTLPDELRDWVVPLAHAIAIQKEEEIPGATYMQTVEGVKSVIRAEFPRQLGVPVRHVAKDLGSYSGFEA